MELVTQIMQLVFFTCSPILVIIALLGLRQIKEARNQVEESKKTRKISNLRESYKLASEQCQHYLTNIIPLQNILNNAIKTKGVEFFDKSKVDIKGDKFIVIPFYKNEQEFNDVCDLPTLEVFNSMEAFSLFFVSKLADDELGYRTVGLTFCSSVKFICQS